MWKDPINWNLFGANRDIRISRGGHQKNFDSIRYTKKVN
jgi:hypothetical protein